VAERVGKSDLTIIPRADSAYTVPLFLQVRDPRGV